MIMRPVECYKHAAPELRRPFTAEAVRFKIQASVGEGAALVVAYIDARLVTERLNLVCPHLWSDEYQLVADSKMLCALTIDGITRRDLGEGYKGGKGLYSDAFKRAAVKFGVGVSLYSIPQIYLKESDGYLKTKGTAKTITPSGDTRCRSLYAAWLDTKGISVFGEPLDHGDSADSVGDVEANTEPEDLTEPTAAQRKQYVDLLKALDINGDEKEMLLRKHGIESGVPATRDQVNGLITELIAKSQEQS